jgi:8-hydroxy-5-deazaflavin:NADPH oxidoreductase
MRIGLIGRGNVGGGLGRLWQAAGHNVVTLGRDGGDASHADVIVVAVPPESISEALGRVTGLDGKTAIDATNAISSRDDSFPSLSYKVSAITGGATAKAFNINSATLYEQAASQRVRPSNLYAADDDPREVTARLIHDAGYYPVFVGGLEQARALEDHAALAFAAREGCLGPYFYRLAAPGDL